MLAKRIIPCLDVCGGRVVKGVEFMNLRDAGDPVEAGERYSLEGADELVFLDITATSEKRRTVIELVDRIAEKVFIPFTVGGGIESLEDISAALDAGADKVSINTGAVRNPEILSKAAESFGSQCIVAAVDAGRRAPGRWEVFICGGREPAGIDALEWAVEVERLGAGEILLTSMNSDGRRAGYDIELTRAVTCSVNIPVIASGGAGSKEHLAEVILEGGADAVLAASIFHYEECSISQVKEYLAGRGIPVRMVSLP